MNNSREPLDDVRVRQAITYAIDKQAVNDIAESGFAEIIGPTPHPTTRGSSTSPTRTSTIRPRPRSS